MRDINRYILVVFWVGIKDTQVIASLGGFINFFFPPLWELIQIRREAISLKREARWEGKGKRKKDVNH